MQNYFIQLLGGIDDLLYALIVFTFMDYITTVFVVIVKKQCLKDKLGLKNVFIKLGIFILISIANIMDTIVAENNSSTIRTAVILFYLSEEGRIIFRNLRHLGLPFPKMLKTEFNTLKDKK